MMQEFSAQQNKNDINGVSEQKTVQKEKYDPKFQIFFANLTPQTTEAEVESYFSQFGSIKNVTIIKDRNTQMSKRFGFVTFNETDPIDSVQKQRPHSIMDRQIDTRRCFPIEYQDKQYFTEKTNILYIGGFKDSTITEEIMRNYFSQFGTITNMNFRAADPAANKNGFVFITYDDFDICDQIIIKNEHNINGNKITVKKYLKKETMAQMQMNQNMMKFGSGQMQMNTPYGMNPMVIMMPQQPFNGQFNPNQNRVQFAAPSGYNMNFKPQQFVAKNSQQQRPNNKPGYSGYPGANSGASYPGQNFSSAMPAYPQNQITPASPYGANSNGYANNNSMVNRVKRYWFFVLTTASTFRLKFYHPWFLAF